MAIRFFDMFAGIGGFRSGLAAVGGFQCIGHCEIDKYFDEGVFGNYGWYEPLGACGLIAWTSEGTPLWKNEKYSIYLG